MQKARGLWAEFCSQVGKRAAASKEHWETAVMLGKVMIFTDCFRRRHNQLSQELLISSVK